MNLSNTCSLNWVVVNSFPATDANRHQGFIQLAGYDWPQLGGVVWNESITILKVHALVWVHFPCKDWGCVKLFYHNNKHCLRSIVLPHSGIYNWKLGHSSSSSNITRERDEADVNWFTVALCIYVNCQIEISTLSGLFLTCYKISGRWVFPLVRMSIRWNGCVETLSWLIHISCIKWKKKRTHMI